MAESTSFPRLRPLGDRLLVKRSAADEKTPGGIILPDAAQEVANRGEVIAVGEGRRLDGGALVPISVTPGAVVFFGKYQGAEIEIDRERYLVLRADEILGVLER